MGQDGRAWNLRLRVRGTIEFSHRSMNINKETRKKRNKPIELFSRRVGISLLGSYLKSRSPLLWLVYPVCRSWWSLVGGRGRCGLLLGMALGWLEWSSFVFFWVGGEWWGILRRMRCSLELVSEGKELMT